MKPQLRVVKLTPPLPPCPSWRFVWRAAGTSPAQEANPPEKVREIFVPFKDLNILLENQPRRVLLSRQQYDELLKKAKITPGPARPPGRRADGRRLQRPRATGSGSGSPARWPSTCWKGPASPAAGPGRRGPALGQARRSRRARSAARPTAGSACWSRASAAMRWCWRWWRRWRPRPPGSCSASAAAAGGRRTTAAHRARRRRDPQRRWTWPAARWIAPPA